VPGLDVVGFPDEWTMPDDWQMPEAALFEDHPQSLAPGYPQDLGELLGVSGETLPSSVPKIFVPAPEEQPPAAGGGHE
jgi:hypothetical protein